MIGIAILGYGVVGAGVGQLLTGFRAPQGKRSG